MTLQEVKDWCKGTHIETWADDSYDDNGNHYESRIYRKDGKFYRLEFCNNHPYEKYVEGKGYIRGEYHGPVEVFQKTRVITETYYETEEETRAAEDRLQRQGRLLEDQGTISTNPSV